MQLGDLLPEWQEEAKAAHEAFRTNTPRGPVTGFRGLDQALSGFLVPGLHVVHGNAGTGKTAFCLQVAATCGAWALYVSAEMGAMELFRRVVARTTGTFLGRLKTGEIPSDDSMQLAQRAARTAADLFLADASAGAVAYPGWVEEVATQMKEQAGKPPLILIDSIHSWAAQCAPSDMAEYDFLNAGIGILRQIGQRLGSPVLAIAERNRASMKAGGLNAAAGTRQFEYSAETMLDLDRKDDAREDANGEVPLTLRLAKNRHGATGRTVKLLFHGALQRFREEKPGNG
jgi:replicative DNA helicase